MAKKFFKISAILSLLMFITFSAPAIAKNVSTVRANVDKEFSIKSKELPEEIQFRTITDKTIPDVITIPANSLINLEIINAQRELRWHKSGLILCKLKSYTPENSNIPVDVSDKDLYVTVKKYEEMNKKEASILVGEILITQGASFFAPGVDIGYFFIKGALQREKHDNWFKAGVYNAYDNSIFWFPQKGKNIELEVGDKVNIKDIKTKKAEKLMKAIEKRNTRFEKQAENRIAKKDARYMKKAIKNEKKLVDCSTVENLLQNVVIDSNGKMIILKKKTDQVFKEACNDNGIVLVDMSKKFMNEYNKNYKVPYGFSNTCMAQGHLNKYGHQMIAEELLRVVR